MLKDAMETVTKTRQFYDTIESVYNFFGHSFVRWQKLQSVHDRSCSNLTLKALNPTQWSGRYDPVYALKERFCDVMKCLTHLILTTRSQRKKIKLWQCRNRYKTLALCECWLCNENFADRLHSYESYAV